jgi:hypothetical protein
MSEKKRDRELGMHCPITRRDFLNGVAVGAGGLLAADPLLAALLAEQAAPEKAPGYYPPALTGMRGNHDATFTYAHQLRDGKRWDSAGAVASTGKHTIWLLWAEESAGWRRRIFTDKMPGRARAFWLWTIMTISAATRSATNFRPADGCCSATVARSRSRAPVSTAM